MPEALALTGITKRFGDTLALDRASLTVARGTVHALLGENGAGKTTLVRVAFGLLRPDDGRIAVDGAPRAFASPRDAIDAGVGMVHQHFTNVPAMTVAENVALGGRGRFDRRGAAARARAVSERAGLPLDPEARVAELPVGAQQRLEIVKALARDARLLILDEPTAVLAPGEASELLAWVRRFADDGGTVVLITHKLREALAVADAVTVLRRGRTVLERPARTVTADDLAVAMLGEDASGEADIDARGTPATPRSAPRDASPVVRAAGVTVRDDLGVARLVDASFALGAGEIVGIAGVEGAGQRELLRAIAGIAVPTAGSLALPDSIAFIPEDRHRDAVVLDFSLAENVALRGAGARRGRMRWSAWRERTRALMRSFDVRAGGVDARASGLSGGNQQKLVLARELADRPELVVAENPTRGLDIRASAFVHAQLREAARAGATVVVYSTDLDEVLALATRLLVVYAGRVRELPVDRELAGRAMLGVVEETR